jgi:hypothetical protein
VVGNDAARTTFRGIENVSEAMIGIRDSSIDALAWREFHFHMDGPVPVVIEGKV